MGQLRNIYEVEAAVIADAASVAGSAVNTGVIQLGSKGSGHGFDGVEVTFEITQSGGSTDADMTVDVLPVYDGVAANVDSEKLGSTITITASATGTSGTHRFSRVFLANQHLAGVGFAFLLAMTRTVGDRDMTVTARARRFRMVETN